MVRFHFIKLCPSRELLDQRSHMLGVTAVGIRCRLCDQTGENVAVDAASCGEPVTSRLHVRQLVQGSQLTDAGVLVGNFTLPGVGCRRGS